MYKKCRVVVPKAKTKKRIKLIVSLFDGFEGKQKIERFLSPETKEYIFDVPAKYQYIYNSSKDNEFLFDVHVNLDQDSRQLVPEILKETNE